MASYYTDEKQAQILLSLLKSHGIKKIIVSPGTTNMPITGSVQYDDYFEVISCVDERSAAYIACGLSAESGEPVAISCTGATASRNYMSGLTEAFYRKLPIIALTSFNGSHLNGNLVPQNIDRSVVPNDVVKFSAELPLVKDKSDEKYCALLVNRAIIESQKDGGGPVHLNLTSNYIGTFNTKLLPEIKAIKRYTFRDTLPSIESKKIAIIIGSHNKFSDELTNKIEKFCENNQAVVLCDHTSAYRGRYRIQSALICTSIRSTNNHWKELKADIVFHLGEVSGDYPTARFFEQTKDIWRISEDGQLKDRGGNLSLLFDGPEIEFFDSLIGQNSDSNNEYFKTWESIDNDLRNIPMELPFSNTWIASKMSPMIPAGSTLNLAILNTLRNWNYFKLDSSISVSSNVGGFGIDGCLSSLVGASFSDSKKLYFSIIGDLAFFYDMNVLGSRHLKNNIRILLINNGCGTEFNNSSHLGSQFGESVGEYISASGHFGSGEENSSRILNQNKRLSKSIAKGYCESLGIKYISVKNKNEFSNGLDTLLNKKSESPILLECFTNPEDESDALEVISDLGSNKKDIAIDRAKKILPSNFIKLAKKAIK